MNTTIKPKYLKVKRTSKSSVYQMSGTVAGIRVRESTHTTDITIAQQVALNKEIDILYSTVKNGRLSCNPRFIECITRYEKEVRYSRKNQGIVNRIRDYFGDELVLDVDQDSVAEFIEQVFMAQGLVYATAYRNLTVLLAIRNHAIKTRMVDRDSLPYLSFEQPSKHTHRISVVDESTREKILELASQPYRDVFVFLWYTGARIGCALNRTWQDRTKPGMRLYSVKGGRSKLRQRREYTVPEVTELTQMLDRRFQEAQSRTGFSLSQKIFNVSDTSVRTELARVCDVLGIENFLPHDIRHCFGTTLAQQKIGIETIADLMGHDSIESARVYINYANDELKQQLQSALSRQVTSDGVRLGR